MPQTFYVTQDEEILSVVGRLRASELLENVFVVPKRALVLQSIVNLRILAREAERLGKSIAIITQDEEGRMLVEKAGIATRSYAEDSADASEGRILSQHIPDGTSIGSDDFFGQLAENGRLPVPPMTRSVKEPGMRVGEVPPIEYRVRVRGNPASHAQHGDIRRVQSGRSVRTHEDASASRSVPKAAPESATNRQMTHAEAQEKLSAFFHHEKPRRDPMSQMKRDESVSHIGVRGKVWLLVLALASMGSLAATTAFVFLPKAEISVIPQSVAQETEIEFDGRLSDPSGDRGVGIRLIEKEGEISVSGTPTGSVSGRGEKSRGKIVIYNRYGAEPQPLVATTRFESSDGKIFRLLKGVTVPGMSTIGGVQEPGAVEAEIIADEAGDSYNIGPGEFTIPGFKGSPKFGKFSAKSQSKMSGGATGEGDTGKAVSASDIEKVKAEAERKFRSIFEEMVGSEISVDERFLVDSAEISLIGIPIAPSVGMASSEFEYSAKFRGRVFVFSEPELRRVAESVFRSRPAVGDDFSSHSMTLSYGSVVPDYHSGRAFIKARVTAMFVAKIDVDAIRGDFLGKSGDEIRETLARHPEIKKLDVVFKPKLFVSSVPKNSDRVAVKVEFP